MRQIESRTLNTILDEYLPAGQEIDYLNIDIEGHEEAALQGLDLKKYRPKIISIEILVDEIETVLQHPVYKILTKEGYQFINKCFFTSIFIDTKSAKNSF